MLRNLKHSCLLVLLFFICACTQPAHAFLDSKGQKINLDDWKGKWVIINYWADWCGACAEEIPQLNLFYQRHQHQVVLIGVDPDNLPSRRLITAMDTLHINFPVLQVDPAKILGLPAISVLPTTFIINPQGKIVKQLFGPQTADGLADIINDRS